MPFGLIAMVTVTAACSMYYTMKPGLEDMRKDLLEREHKQSEQQGVEGRREGGEELQKEQEQQE